MMTKSAVVLISFGLILFAGFIYLKSKPAPVIDQQIEIETNKNENDKSETSTLNSNTKTNMKEIKQYPTPPEMALNKTKKYSATVKTNKGEMVVNLFSQDSPVAVNNFVFLAKEKFYDNTNFHRIISGFMIQGGDPAGNGTGGPGYKFEDEEVVKDYKRGIMAMANAGPDTNGSQFFIMHQDNEQLPKNYVIFGELVGEASFTTLDKIANTPVTANLMGEKSQPSEAVSIQSIEIKEN